MSMKETIEDRLTAALSPTHLEVRDDSRLHAGHAGARPGGADHTAQSLVAS